LTGALRALCVEHSGGSSLLEELDMVITRQAKIVGAPIGIVVRSGETRLPYHDPASDLRIEVYRELATWGVVMLRENPHLDRVQRTPIATGEWLAYKPGLLANLPGVESLHANLVRLRRDIERMIDRPATTVMLGICSTVLEDGTGCPKHLYAVLDDENRPPAWIRCPQCGAEHEVLARQQALVAQGRLTVGTAAEVSRVLGKIGIIIPASTIRSWAQKRISRGKVIEPRIKAVEASAEWHPLYRIDDVLGAYLKGLEKKGKAA
jgi:hypothetical protein